MVFFRVSGEEKRADKQIPAIDIFMSEVIIARSLLVTIIFSSDRSSNAHFELLSFCSRNNNDIRAFSQPYLVGFERFD